MVKVKSILIAIIICAVSLLSACSGNGEGSNQPSSVSNSPQNIHETADKKEKTNAERFLEYVKEAAYLRKFTETGDYAGIGITLHDIYKDDIVNPYTGGSSIYVMNRTRTYMKNKNMSVTKGYGVDCVLIDDYMTQLKKIDTNEVVYCVNPESKGMVFAFWFIDGVYIYEIDENGNKINEIKHFFEKENKEE
ncbi:MULTISPECIES: hypothetical protein [Acetivibrio]|jgi:hypothetical protein|uniref:Lipoprotein n=1 Tax=Acetivibrio straminisolvens JCM 21531 TaxID=1294263 RepID=W4VCU8_9FIRM|nr:MULTISPECIES: hypothetical protein [Acetivibrio]THJ77191.1 hypothetical protein EPD62_12520 [Acetivibrio thermocellus]GAE90996.1 hypothetical protein JCM21531_4664 [Acetivibrio straminisolvens JCM 21531]